MKKKNTQSIREPRAEHNVTALEWYPTAVGGELTAIGRRRCITENRKQKKRHDLDFRTELFGPFTVE
jgi:hypothetical protein